jgi:carbon monoxide dehydrogenase subunit G
VVRSALFLFIRLQAGDRLSKPNNNSEGIKMYFEGMVNIVAPRDEVWEFLTNAEFVSRCAPGVKEMEIVVPNEKYLAVAAVGFGSVVVTFKADVEFQELKEPEFAKVKAHGDASDSAVDVLSEMHLSRGLDGSTDLNWNADIVVVGKIASVASRMMGSVTKKLTTMFFECVKKQIEA